MERRTSAQKGRLTPTDIDSMEKFEDGGLIGDNAFIQQQNIEIDVVAKVFDGQSVVAIDLTQPFTIRPSSSTAATTAKGLSSVSGGDL